MSSAVINYLGLILGVLSILATIYFAVKYSERKQPTLHSISQSKISISDDAPQSIAVSYEGEKVPRVSSTIVRFWNAGRRPIKKDDIPTNQPLLLKIADGSEQIKILDVNVLKTSRPATNFRASKNAPSTVKLEFDFLDENDGAAIEIQHTGTWRTSVEPTGVILGASKGVKVVPSRTSGILPGLDRRISLPLSGKTYRKPKLLARFFASIALVGVIGGFTWFIYKSSTEIITTPSLIDKTLSAYIAPEQVVVVSTAIQKTAKYQLVNKIVQYPFMLILCLNMVYGLIIIWRRSYPFPESLLIDMSASSPASKTADKAPSV